MPKVPERRNWPIYVGSEEPAKKKNQMVITVTASDTLITITTSSTERGGRESSSPRIDRCHGGRTRTTSSSPDTRA